jgi:hypothetical protein
VSDTLRVLPLGGLGEIGKNMTVLECERRMVVVDTGLMFPTPDQLGIDLVLPDFSYLRERAADIEAIVLTHGHEDHVGALPYVLREIGDDAVPAIYGGPLTVEMVRSKLEEHRLSGAALEPLVAGQDVDAGPFSLELVKVAHSIPDAFAVALRSPLGVERRSPPRAGVWPLSGPDHRHLVRLQHPPRAAGGRRGRGARAQGGARRAIDAQVREHRAAAGPHRGPRGDVGRGARDRGLTRA